MSIRRKRRQRGKRKELRREALKTWDRLTCVDKPRQYAGFPGFGSVVIPMVRRIMPSVIAKDLVGVQPMTAPAGMMGDISAGIAPTFTYRYDTDGNRTKKEISEQRKKERKAKKRGGGKRFGLEKTEWPELDFKVTVNNLADI